MKKLPPKLGSKRNLEQHVLLVDGNALYKRGFIGARDEYNHNGKPIGGIYQFLTVLRKILSDDLYHKVFVFWDGNFSGKLRWEIYKDYKSGRGKDYVNGTQPEDPEEIIQRGLVFNYLEELSIKQLKDPDVESDDFIAYYCKIKDKNTKITIATSDRDLCQLVDEDIRIYMLDLKSYVTHYNFQSYFKHHKDNSVLMKIICGDNSDSIKGIKRVGEASLIKHFPEITKQKVELTELINKAKILQNERITNKEKPLQLFTNIIDSITDGIQGQNIYEINQRLVDLSIPLLTEQALENVNNLIDSPLSDDRSIKSVYKMLKDDGIDKMMGEIRYSEYLLPFKKLIEREKTNNYDR